MKTKKKIKNVVEFEGYKGTVIDDAIFHEAGRVFTCNRLTQLLDGLKGGQVRKLRFTLETID